MGRSRLSQQETFLAGGKVVWANDCILLLGVFHVAAAPEGGGGGGGVGGRSKDVKFALTSDATHLSPTASLFMHLDHPNLTHNM